MSTITCDRGVNTAKLGLREQPTQKEWWYEHSVMTMGSTRTIFILLRPSPRCQQTHTEHDEIS